MSKYLATTKPVRMWIDGKCFNIERYKRKSNYVSCVQADNQDDGYTCNNIQYSALGNGQFSTRFHLPKLYYTKMGRFFDDIRKLSNDTQTNITIPRNGKDGDLVITGGNKTNIEVAMREIHSVVALIRNQNVALQFISIPLLSDVIKQNFLKFKDEVLADTTIEGMDASIFQSSLKLHLTVTVFVLLDEREQSEAIEALQHYKKTVLDPLLKQIGPLKIRVAGIDCMNNNYRKVDVLYANAKIVDEVQDNSLQKIVNGLSDYFYERGLVKNYQDNVKLHMTVLNTKYRKSADTSANTRKTWGRRQTFNATTIMEKYKDYEFGDCNFDAIHLSLMSSKGDDGFYKPLSIIALK